MQVTGQQLHSHQIKDGAYRFINSYNPVFYSKRYNFPLLSAIAYCCSIKPVIVEYHGALHKVLSVYW